MESVPRVFVPEVLAYNSNVIISKWVDGMPLRSIPSWDDRLKDAQALMRDAYCQSMYVDAFFHADGHGGNLLWVEKKNDDDGRSNSSTRASSGELCILDCGLMVDIEPSAAEGLLRLSLHLASRDWTRVVDDVIALGFLPENLSPNLKAEARGIARRIIGPYLDVGGGAKAASAYSISSLFDDISSATLKLPTALPPDMILLARAVIQLEGLALRAYPDYRLIDDILPVAARIALRAAPASDADNNSDDARASLLFDLLYEDSRDIFGEENILFSPERLLQLLGTARGSGGDGGRASGSSISIEEIVDELLQADAARDLVAQETFNVLDVLMRDTIWRGVDMLQERGLPLPPAPPPVIPKFGPPPRKVLETLIPRTSEKEQLILVRLLEVLNELEENASDSSSSRTSALPLLTNRPSLFNESPLIKVATIPGVNRSLKDVAVSAVFGGDNNNARRAIDAVSERTAERLLTRLIQTGMSRELASAISNTVLQRPRQVR